MLTTPASTVTSLVIRDLDSTAELRTAEQLQQDVWGIDDRDVVPLTHFVAARAAGGVIVGAFDRDTLAGFVYGFPSIDEDGPAMHSHLLAVRPEYRRRRLAFDLKRAQRERSLAKGITRITWTFDPLRTANAQLNFARLGVVADRYLPDFYGAETSSDLDRDGTDRLWVTWFLESARVTQRLDGFASDAAAPALADAQPLLRVGSDGQPLIAGLGDVRSGPQSGREGLSCYIEIPQIELLDRDLSNRWRQATRRAFRRALAAGYRVEEFSVCAAITSDLSPAGAYLLGLDASAR